MKLLTKAIIDQFKKIGDQRNEKDPIIVCKFFAGWAYTFFATWYDEENWILEWYATMWYWYEFGTVFLSELQNYRWPFGLWIERDLYYRSKRASEQHELTNYFLKNFA